MKLYSYPIHTYVPVYTYKKAVKIIVDQISNIHPLWGLHQRHMWKIKSRSQFFFSKVFVFVHPGVRSFLPKVNATLHNQSCAFFLQQKLQLFEHLMSFNCYIDRSPSFVTFWWNHYIMRMLVFLTINLTLYYITKW